MGSSRKCTRVKVLRGTFARTIERTEPGLRSPYEKGARAARPVPATSEGRLRDDRRNSVERLRHFGWNLKDSVRRARILFVTVGTLEVGPRARLTGNSTKPKSKVIIYIYFTL